MQGRGLAGTIALFGASILQSYEKDIAEATTEIVLAQRELMKKGNEVGRAIPSGAPQPEPAA